jgi:hypothetical protein
LHTRLTSRDAIMADGCEFSSSPTSKPPSQLSDLRLPCHAV